MPLSPLVLASHVRSRHRLNAAACAAYSSYGCTAPQDCLRIPLPQGVAIHVNIDSGRATLQSVDGLVFAPPSSWYGGCEVTSLVSFGRLLDKLLGAGVRCRPCRRCWRPIMPTVKAARGQQVELIVHGCTRAGCVQMAKRVCRVGVC